MAERKKLDCIFDGGKVFRPNPYNIPCEPYKVGAFTINMIMAMMDTNLISPEYFQQERDFHRYRDETLSLLREFERRHREIEYQEF